MLQRILIHISLILLFAFTQMGVTTHSVSHLTDAHEQQQQDQNSTENQCEQCISLSHAADANLQPTFDFKVASSSHIFTASILTSFPSKTSLSYSARAPPYTLQA